MRRLTINLVRRLLFAGIVFAAVGCEFDPHSDVHSATCPDPVLHDGVWWLAMKCDGESDEYFWLPAQVAEIKIGADKPWPVNSVEILVKGKVWRITRQPDGTVDYQGWIEPDVEPTGDVIVCLLLMAVVTCIAVGFGLHSGARLKKARELMHLAQQEAASLKSLEEDRRKRFNQEWTEVKKERSQLDEVQTALDARQAAVDDAERRLRQLAVSNPKDLSSVRPPSRRKQRDLGKAVRDECLRGNVPGKDITISYCIDPELTGAVVFQFQILLNQPYAPHLTVWRNGQVLRTFDSFNGEIKDFLEVPGERYRYIFELSEGKRKFPEPLVIDLPLPYAEAWTRRTIPPPRKKRISAAERKRAKAAWVEEEKAKAAAYETDPKKLKESYAKIEQEAVDKFGEAE